MINIYANSYFETPNLTPENLVENFETYAERLDEMAKNYRKLGKFLKSKKVKILDADGFSFTGKFCVDDIDAERLKKSGLVHDMTENPSEDLPLFYIDTVVDEAMEKAEDDDDDLTIEQVFGLKDAPIMDITLDADDIEEKSCLVNLAELFKNAEVQKAEKGDDTFTPGTLVVDVKSAGGDEFNFNLTVADLSEDPIGVTFNREKLEFEYKCGGCENTHTESLKSVYRSLKTTSALLSNLVALITDPKELAIALEFIDQDIRLLQHLIAFDYAINDNEGEMPDHDHDHDHDDDDDDDDDDDGDIEFESDINLDDD